jgi:PAS domain S-box-containing protein
VIIVDPVTRVIENVNDAATTMFGSPKDHIIGHRCHAFICPASEDACPICDLGKEVDNAEKEILCADGSRCPVLKSVKRVQMQGHEKLLECFLDITDRKKAEEELRQNRDHLEERVRERTAEMERFIYTVSHDLRSPLVTMSGFVGLLKGDLEKGDSQRAFDDLITISEAITKMDRLLLDTLELSRIGRVASLPAEEPFNQIVREAINQTEGRIESRNVAVYVAEGMPKVRVDVPRIVEVLVNLIENSVKYMGDRDRPEIDIGSRKDGEETVFFIRDNGIGIDSKEHEKVFGLFYKVDRKSEGTGAGLAIVKRIIEVHRGRIWIESELGRGCTVCFTLPLARVA